MTISDERFELNMQGLAVAAGGAVSEKVFVNGAIGQSGNTTGAVVSGTYRWK